MEMGRRWTPENLAAHQLVICNRWFWRPAWRCAVSSACATSGTSPSCTAARSAAAPSPTPAPAASTGQSLGQRIVARSGRLEVRDAAALRHCVAHAGRHREPHPGPGRQPAETSCRQSVGVGDTFLSHPASRSCRRAKGSPAAPPFPTPSSAAKVRNARPARLRRLHDGLPPRRQEHARSELSLSRRKARRASLRRDESCRCSSARRRCRWQRRIRGPHRELLPPASTRHRRRFTCRGVVFAASSLGTMELLFHLKDKGSLPAISDQLGRYVRTNSESLHRRARAGFQRRSVARASPSAPAFTSTSTRTLRRCVIPKAPTPWACWPPF